MADSSAPSTPTADSATGESKAQREARLRRERRNAKIQAGGSERLSKITSLSGRPAAAEAELTRTPPTKAPSGTVPAETTASSTPSQRQASVRNADDPEEVDITNMFARGQQAPQSGDDALRMQQEAMRQMLRRPDGNDSDANDLGANANDPLMQMMQQMLGGATGPDGQPGDAPQLPPGLADLLGGKGAGADTVENPEAAVSARVWRVVHALFSVLLAVYAAATSSFTGTQFARTASAAFATDQGVFSARLFYMFVTAELVLQTTRYIVDRGRLPHSGLLATVAGFLPKPFDEYVRLLNRYSIIYTTVTQDALVVIFVLGCAAWWHSATGSI